MNTPALNNTSSSAPAPDGPRPFGPEKPVDPKRSVFASEYPFDSHWLNVSDETDPLWLHYLDEGPKDAPVLIMLHGNPTWSFFYRDAIKTLSKTYRCIVPDHMGCGLSDRPPHWSYRLADHAKNVERLIDHLGLSRFSLMVHDWGGMIGFTVATARPEAVQSTIVLNTAAFNGKLPKRIATVRIPVFGQAAVLGFNAFVRAAVFGCTHHKERLTDPIKAGFLAPYSTPNDRLATLRFVEDVPLKPGHPSWDLVAETDGKLSSLRDKPMLICWGERDWCFTPEFRKGWQERFPDAEVHAIEDGAHFILEDAKERVLPWVSDFLQRALSEAPAAAVSARPSGADAPQASA